MERVEGKNCGWRGCRVLISVNRSYWGKGRRMLSRGSDQVSVVRRFLWSPENRWIDEEWKPRDKSYISTAGENRWWLGPQGLWWKSWRVVRFQMYILKAEPTGPADVFCVGLKSKRGGKDDSWTAGVTKLPFPEQDSGRRNRFGGSGGVSRFGHVKFEMPARHPRRDLTG